MNALDCNTLTRTPHPQEVTLRDALLTMQGSESALSQHDVPLIIQLVENPKYESSYDPFPGRVTLEQHDCIHILLNRGMSSQDEAFVIGFTMGSSKELSFIKQELFLAIARFFYPKKYRFSQEEAQIFREAATLGHLSDCPALADVDFPSLMDEPLSRIRATLRLESYVLSEQTITDE